MLCSKVVSVTISDAHSKLALIWHMSWGRLFSQHWVCAGSPKGHQLVWMVVLRGCKTGLGMMVEDAFRTASTSTWGRSRASRPSRNRAG